MDEEHRLQHLGPKVIVILGIRRGRKDVFGIVVLLEVKQDGGRFDDGEVVSVGISDRRDTAVGLEFKEPWLGKKGRLDGCTRCLVTCIVFRMVRDEIDEMASSASWAIRMTGESLTDLFLSALANVNLGMVVLELGVNSLELLKEDCDLLRRHTRPGGGMERSD